MSQSIRISSSGLGGPILQHVPNTSSSSSSSSCMFFSTGHKEVGFPINLSLKECTKRAWISSVAVSNRNHPQSCAATLKSSSNVDLDDEDDGNKVGKYYYGDPLKVVLLRISQAWMAIGSALRYKISKLRYKVSKGVVATMIFIDLRADPIDGLKVLLDVSETWRMILSLNGDLYDGKGFDDGYGESYHRKARMEEGGKHREGKNPPLKLTKSKLFILRMLADLDDPNDGLKFLLGDLEFWRTVFSSNELNDSEGYLQKEIFALRDLSLRARISVSNRNGKHDEAKNPPSPITNVLARIKFMIDNSEDPSDVLEAMQESFRSRKETSARW